MTYHITEKQLEKIYKWMATLPPCKPTAIGGRYSYIFTPTSLGYSTIVEDCISGEKLDVTDYENW